MSREPETISVEEYRKLVAQLAPAPNRRDDRSRRAAARKRLPKIKLPREKRDPSIGAVLSRLMRPMSTGRLTLKPEENLSVRFADQLRELTIAGRLRAVWTHPANEIAGRESGLSKIRYTIAKAMGLIDGTSDYLFLWGSGSGALEAKHGKNGQQPNQKDFQAWCELNNVPYRIFTTVEEGLAILREWGVLD